MKRSVKQPSSRAGSAMPAGKVLPKAKSSVTPSAKTTGTKTTAKRSALKPLTKFEQRFCEEYIVDLNGTQAYLRAGAKVTDGSARALAAKLLAKINVKEFVTELEAARSEKTGTDAEMVVKAWRQIATANPNDLMEFRRGCCRFCWGVNFRYQRTPQEMESHRNKFEADLRKKLDDRDFEDPALRASIYTELSEAFDGEGGIGYNSTKDPNPECPECFGEGVGYAYFKDTRRLPAPALRLYGGVKVTKEGIEVKVNSQEKAIEMLARHNGMLTEKTEVSGPNGGPIEHKHDVNLTAEESYKRMLEG